MNVIIFILEMEQAVEQRKDLIRNLTDEIMKHIIDLGNVNIRAYLT